MKNIYFSNIVNIEEDIQKFGNLLCYIAPCGSGKTYFIMDKEEGLASKGKVLCITSRKAKVDEDVASEENDFENDFKSDNCEVTNMKLLYKIKSLMEYENNTAKMDEFIDKFDYIVVDEVHSLACDSLFQNNLVTIISFLKYAGLVRNKTIIALSATIEPAERFLIKELNDGNKKMEIIDKREGYLAKLPGVIVNSTKEKAMNAIKAIVKNGEKIIYFANTYDSLEALFEEFIKLGIDKRKIVIAMSQANQNKFYKNNKFSKKEEKIVEEARRYLAENSELPPDISVLIATSTYKEGIGIKNLDIDYVFCESHYVPDIIQFMGRVRKPAKFFQVVSDSTPIFSSVGDMEYGFCYREDFRETCKKYLLTLKYERKGIDEKKKFIEFLNNKFQYLSYDFFNNEFVVDNLRYNMQNNLMESGEGYAWENRLEEFIKKYSESVFYNISAAWRDFVKEKTLKGIRDILGKPQIGKEKVGHVYDLFASAYGIKDRKLMAFKEALKPLFYNVEIIDTTKDKKHIRGITVTLDRGDEFFEQLISFLTESQK